MKTAGRWIILYTKEDQTVTVLARGSVLVYISIRWMYVSFVHAISNPIMWISCHHTVG